MPLLIPQEIINRHVSRGLPSLNIETIEQKNPWCPPPSRNVTRAEMLESCKRVLPEIMKIANLPTSEGWSVIDSRPTEGLYMITPDEDHIDSLSDIIGAIIDVPKGVIVSRTLPKVGRVFSKGIINEKGFFRLTDLSGKEHVISEDEVLIHPKIEGIDLNVFYHNGHMYISSATKMHVDMSRIPEMKTNTFTEMYEALGGPTAEELFDTRKKFSPNVYHFVISTPETILCSKIPCISSFLVYLGKTQTVFEYPVDDTDFSEWNLEGTSDDFSFVLRNKGVIYHSKNISPDVANIFLRDGYGAGHSVEFSDERLEMGEAITLTVTPKNGGSPYQIMVESPGYNWRFDFLNEERNLKLRFYNLAQMRKTDTRTPGGLQNFISKIPLLPLIPMDTLIKHIETSGHILSYPQDIKADPRNLHTVYGKLHNIWSAFILALPFNRQSEAAGFLRDFHSEIYEVAEWIMELNETYEDLAELPIKTSCPRIEQMIKSARKSANQQHFSDSFENQVGRNLDFYVKNENTASLYRIVQTMKKTKSSQC